MYGGVGRSSEESLKSLSLCFVVVVVAVGPKNLFFLGGVTRGLEPELVSCCLEVL